MKAGVFVLGMHRSGTSAATRLVNLLGVPTCIAEDLMPASTENPTGYWESVALTDANDRLLARLGCDWTCPVALADGWELDTELDDLRNEALELFPRVVPSTQWVWKDPRNCITFPFWTRCVDARPVAVLLYRNPLEVAASLCRRVDFGTAYSLALWERYLRLCIAALTDVPTLVTDYADLMADPVAWCSLVSDFLNASGVVTGPIPPETVLGFVDGRLRHARFPKEALADDPAVSEEQARLLDALDEMRGPHVSLRPPALPKETRSTEALLAERRYAYSRERRYLALEAVLETYTHAFSRQDGGPADYVRSGQLSSNPNFGDLDTRVKLLFAELERQDEMALAELRAERTQNAEQLESTTAPLRAKVEQLGSELEWTRTRLEHTQLELAWPATARRLVRWARTRRRRN